MKLFDRFMRWLGAWRCRSCDRWSFRYGELVFHIESPFTGHGVCSRVECQQAAFNHNACKWGRYYAKAPDGTRYCLTIPASEWHADKPSEFWYVKNKKVA